MVTRIFVSLITNSPLPPLAQHHDLHNTTGKPLSADKKDWLQIVLFAHLYQHIDHFVSMI